jgi:hypothetical protein
MARFGTKSNSTLASGTLSVLVVMALSVSSLPLNNNDGHHYRHHDRGSGHDIVVIQPTFTAAAYQPHGFYDYYRKNCNVSCLTVSLHPKRFTDLMRYAGSNNAIDIIKSKDIADIVSDEQVTLNPSILKNYRKVIVLHNEYVTQKEFDAIRQHRHVLYLYANALYAQVTYDSKHETITLEKGHGYKGISHAFRWGPAKTTKYEYDTSCRDWHLKRVINGLMLQCYPENRILSDERLWEAIKK